jgi:hypothetical protein
MFKKDFLALLNRCKNQYGFPDDFIVGSGNPASDVLLVGREPSNDALLTNTLGHYLDAAQGLVKDSWTHIKREEYNSSTKQGPSHWRSGKALWAQYQKLCDIIYPEFKKDRREIIDFEEHVFCSEMNGSPSPRTGKANTEFLAIRKELFFTDPFFDRFPVIVLACGDYIHNTSPNPEEREIDRIFHVSFFEEKRYGNRNAFWLHYNEDRTRLVIHTRNLCSDVSKGLIEGIGEEVHQFLHR